MGNTGLVGDTHWGWDWGLDTGLGWFLDSGGKVGETGGYWALRCVDTGRLGLVISACSAGAAGWDGLMFTGGLGGGDPLGGFNRQT